MKNIIIWSVLYFVGIILLIASGVQAMNGMVYAGIILGIVGIVYGIMMKQKKQE